MYIFLKRHKKQHQQRQHRRKTSKQESNKKQRREKKRQLTAKAIRRFLKLIKLTEHPSIVYAHKYQPKWVYNQNKWLLAPRWWPDDVMFQYGLCVCVCVDDHYTLALCHAPLKYFLVLDRFELTFRLEVAFIFNINFKVISQANNDNNFPAYGRIIVCTVMKTQESAKCEKSEKDQSN